MKKKIMLVALTFAAFGLQAQKLKDLKNKLNSQLNGGTTTEQTGEKKEENSAASATPTTITGENQFVMFDAFFKSGNKVFVGRAKPSEDMYVEGREILINDFKGEVVLDEKNNIKVWKGYLSDAKPNEATYPVYFRARFYLYFVNDLIIESTDGLNTAEEVEKYIIQADKVLTVYCTNKSKIKKMKGQELANTLKTYLGEASKKVNEIRTNEKASADKAETEKRARLTTQGKEVVKLRIEALNDKLRQGQNYTYNVIATLKDGQELATDKGAYIDEYEVTYTGLGEAENEFGMKVPAVSGTMIRVPMTSTVQGDKITITVKSKHHPKLTATKTFTMEYDEAVQLNYAAQSQSTAGYQQRAGSLRIELKQIKHGVTNEDILEYKVFNISDGKLMKHFRLKPGTPVNVNVNGASGWASSAQRVARDGGDGGDVTLIIDPSVKTYTVNIQNKGGSANGGIRPGNPGKVEKQTMAVSW